MTQDASILLALNNLQRSLTMPRSFESLSALIADFAREHLQASKTALDVATPDGRESQPESGLLHISLSNSPLCLTFERADPFRPVDVALAELIGAILSTAPYHIPNTNPAVPVSDEPLQNEQLEAIYHIVRSAGALRPLRQTLAEIHGQVMQICRTPSFVVALRDLESDFIRFPYAVENYHLVDISPIPLSSQTSICAWVITHDLPIISTDWASAEKPVGGVLIGETTPRSVMWLPLRAGSEVVGAFSVQSDQPDALDENAYRVLRVMADHLAVIIKNAQLYSTMQMLVDNVVGEYLVSSAVRRAVTNISTSLDLDSTLEQLLISLSEVVQFASASVGLLEEGRVVFRMHRPYVGADASLLISRANDAVADSALVRSILEQQRPLWIDDVRLDPRWKPMTGLDYVRGWIGAPLIAGSKPVGVLTIDSVKVGAYGEREAWLVSTLAAHAALAIHNARLHEEVQRQVIELRTLYDASATMTANLDLDFVLQAVVRTIVHALSLDSCTIFVQDTGRDTLRLAAHENQLRADQPGSVLVGMGQLENLASFATVSQVLSQREIRALRLSAATTADERSLLDAAALKSLLLVPLVQRDQVLGLLALGQERHARRFSSYETRLAQNLASQAAVAIEHAHLFTQAQRRVRELSAFHEIVLRLNSPLELEVVLQYITESALALIGASNLHIFLYDHELQDFTFCSALWRDGRRTPAVTQPRPDGLTATVVRTGELVVIDDARSHPLYQAQSARIWGIHAIAGFPLKHDNQVIGVFTVTYLEPHIFSHDELLLMNLLAEQAAVAVENARLYTDATRRLRNMSALVETAKQVTGNLKLELVMDTTVRMLQRVFDARACTIALLMPEGDELVIAAGVGIKPEFQNVRMKLGDGVSGKVVRTRAPIYVRDTYEQPDFLFFDAVVRSLLAVPLITRDKVIGTLTVDSDQPDAFGQSDIQMMTIASAQVSIAIANARLFEALEERAAELALAYEELSENDRLKDELVQNVSHELRTPLTFIRGYVDLILEGEMGELTPEQASSLSIVSDKTDEITRLVADIMALQRITAATLVIEPFSMVELIDSALRYYQIGNEYGGAQLSFRPCVQSGIISGDKGRINQVLDNLIGNALKFSPNGGEITVRLLERADDVLVVVEDQGIGVPPDKVSRIFERFYQVDGSSRRRFGGAGLGLAIVKRIVDAHKGDIWVKSELNRGSTFYVLLPKVTADVDQEGGSSQVSLPGRLGNVPLKG